MNYDFLIPSNTHISLLAHSFRINQYIINLVYLPSAQSKVIKVFNVNYAVKSCIMVIFVSFVTLCHSKQQMPS